MSSDGHQGSGGYDPSPSGSQQSAEAPDPLLGQVLDARYRVTDRLGEGGMGEVYAAEHVHISKRVAIKLLRKEIVSNEEAVARFRQEARSASEIGHDNIIKIEDFGELKDGRIYLCMELLDGAPLNDIICDQQFPPAQLLDILIQTCHGLGAAHQAGVIHRDMKPENIFVTRNAAGSDVPKLLDFGIAKVSGADGQNHLTRTGTIFGTPFYMAPEQALGQAVDHRADIYALGVIMYEVFTGSIPFSGESFMGILTKHITAEPKRPSEMAAEHGRTLFSGIEDIILRTMKKEPGERYQSMEELVEALVAVRRGVAGAGMSSYMEAHAPPPGVGAGPASSPMPMPGQSHPTPPPSGHPGFPTPPSQGAMPTPMPSGPESGPYQTHPSAPYPVGSPSASYFAEEPPKRSKVGLIALVIALLAAAGGGGAFFYISQQRAAEAEEERAEAAGESGEESGKIAGAGATEEGEAGEEGKAGEEGEESGAAGEVEGEGEQGIGLGDEEEGTGEEGEGEGEGEGEEEVAEGQEGQEGEGAVEKVRVLIKSKPRGAAAFLDGERLKGKRTPFLLEVEVGTPVEIELKRKGFRDATVAVDGEKAEIEVDLDRIRRPDNKPDEPVAFCDRPENKNKIRCLPKNDCRRPENRDTPRCRCKRNPNDPVCALE